MPGFDPDLYTIPAEALEERFVTAGGPGGQNVNKVATAVQLRVDIFRLGLPVHVFRKLKELAGSRLNSEGVIVIQAQRFRTQEANREDARNRFVAMLAKAHEREERRIATRPSKASKARRIEAKKARSTIKAGRGKYRPD
ncbi:aminoacyl-tRNA hydrolase [Sphingobium jiangsuense]|uniref:Ribosome-associated protein n=1 Tax=Sphingobium jiangsuense TaxID=870476 RepID=A0A7W6BMB2_9SPHN|nr:alternative ribosome rescue aminoacyl-tRNA hydrolase ArfB [Sphingobium jiangsuense]MBB3927576.1 ribosome-associated protein [Sphingobium jiangsuense]GLS98769.1 aminoacyl-tRNA hydrolase [Sphingobium jiangsuense]